MMMRYAPPDILRPDLLHSLQVDSDRASAVAHGAHVLSWVAGGRERLYVSPCATVGDGRAIRGGVPIIFPQFGELGPGPRHGFARLRPWQAQPSGEPHTLVYSLRDDEHTRATWPHAFRAQMTVSLRDCRLELNLSVTNPGDQPFAFTGALHTYLAVSDASTARLSGLQGSTYLDATVPGRPLCHETPSGLQFMGEIDRVYLGTGGRVLELSGDHGTLQLTQSGFADTVVWNPGQAVGDTILDLGAGEYRYFVCVEAAAVAAPIQLAAGERWTGGQILELIP